MDRDTGLELFAQDFRRRGGRFVLAGGIKAGPSTVLTDQDRAYIRDHLVALRRHVEVAALTAEVADMFGPAKLIEVVDSPEPFDVVYGTSVMDRVLTRRERFFPGAAAGPNSSEAK